VPRHCDAESVPATRDRCVPAAARVRASSRSSFFRLSPIKRTLRACATITSCPNSFTNRLTHGECVPVSIATPLSGIAPNTSRTAFGVVLSLCSKTTSPPSSNTQYQLQRSPRSNPTVCFFCVKILLCLPATVILFLIAGLLYLFAPRARLSLGAYRIPPGDRHSHPICWRQLIRLGCLIESLFRALRVY